MIGDTSRLAIVPRSFSPATMSVPIPIAPANKRMVTKYGSIVPSIFPPAFWSSWMIMSGLSEFTVNTVSCCMSSTRSASSACRYISSAPEEIILNAALEYSSDGL